MDEFPAPNPLPAWLSTKAQKVAYYHNLLKLLELFSGCPADQMPPWLVDAAYDCAFDPDIQAHLGG